MSSTLYQGYEPKRAFTPSEEVASEHEQAPEWELYQQDLGKDALFLDGFSLLGEVESPNQDIRDRLEAQIINQPQAIDAIINALDRGHARTTNRPLATLAFLGPTGVGKTETAKVLADIMAERGGKGLIKIDCAQYAQGHEVMSLVGAPPSYVGREQAPLLAPEFIEGHGTVVLFDEIEKGHEKLHNLLLHIMGDGELRMNNGGKVTSFRDAIVILTSNLGASEMNRQLSQRSLGFSKGERATTATSDVVTKAARNGFENYFEHKPEFVNRLDNLAVFHPLGREGLQSVLNVKLEQANALYQKYFGAKLTLSEKTRDYLVEKALAEPQNGARPVVRAFEQDVQSHFGKYIGAGRIPDGTHVHVVHGSELPPMAPEQPPLVFKSRPEESFKRPPQSMEIVKSDSYTLDQGEYSEEG